MAQTTKVLLIDDDEEEFFLVKDQLQRVPGREYDLSWCETIDSGMESVLAGEHDAYLIDIRIGPESGLELLKEIKKERLIRASIILTGQGNEKVDQSAMEMGAFDYLVKGEFDAKELDRAIRYAIERKKGKESLQIQAEILRNVHDAVIFINGKGKILNWNEGASRIFKKKPSEVVGASLYEIFQHNGKEVFTDRIIPQLEEKGIAEEVMHFQLNSGEQLVIQVKATTMSRREFKGYIICASDITEQKNLEAEIIRVSENEQRRIGQDIHDDLCSHLAGIAMITKALENQFRENQEKETKLIAEISEMVAEAGDKARQIAKGLVPSVLETMGLPGAIHELANQTESLFGVECIAKVSGTELIESLDPAVKVQLFRIAQEATTNARKHSDAKLIEIQMTGENGIVTMVVSDDGKGIPDKLVSNGMGMLTMRRRAELIGGKLELHSIIGEGTRIVCSVNATSYGKEIENRDSG